MPDIAQRKAEKSPKSLSILSQFGLTCREGTIAKQNTLPIILAPKDQCKVMLTRGLLKTVSIDYE